MRLIVWVDDWQMQCCGEPFSVGTTVRWTAVPTDMRDHPAIAGAAGAPHIDLHEEHHGDFAGMRRVEGRVLSIRAVYHRQAPLPDNPRHFVPVEGSAEFVTVTRATGWDGPRSGVDFAGYLVEVDAGVSRPRAPGSD